MSQYQSIFKRYEKKYRINHLQYKRFKKDLDLYMEEDQFGIYTICNLYYDTDDYRIIRKSIEKPTYKEKLRVRSYGTPTGGDKVFFELKKKYNKEVFKRRISLTYKEFEDYMHHGIVPNVSPQILKEIEYFIQLYKPCPKIYIAYDRLALFGKEDAKVRVTFDENIRFRTGQLALEKGDQGRCILPYGDRIMEIKVEGAMPLWLCKLLSKHKILPTSFSKYGVCYQQYGLCESMAEIV